MRIGAIFPQTEIGNDPGEIREYGVEVEKLGYRHILVFDHVIGANLAHRPDWKGPYNLETSFHEPFVLFGFLAGVTKTVELTTGIIILPQRQTVLAAKQAAALDVLSGGRFRFGIGLGWNQVEYESLNEDFTNRGSRSVEQIELMRKLWTDKSVEFKGKWHSVPDAGLKPLPVQQPIPVWMGGGNSERALKRIARISDGWMTTGGLTDEGQAAIERFRGYLSEYGRDDGSVGLEGWVKLNPDDLSASGAQVEQWRDLGATHVSINTMGLDRVGGPAHLELLRAFAGEVSLG
jgi:probable F420-dependent oxidoreductase